MGLKDILETRKVKIACGELGISEEGNKIYVFLNNLFNEGMTTEDSLEIPVGDFEAMRQIMPKSATAAMKSGYRMNEIRGAFKIHLDPFYRQIYFRKYDEIVRPLMGKITLTEVLKSYF